MVFARIVAALALFTLLYAATRRTGPPRHPLRPSPSPTAAPEAEGVNASAPVLSRIDRARDEWPLAAEPSTEQLEARARELTDEFWSELAWITGSVPAAGWDLVTNALDQLAGRSVDRRNGRGHPDC